MAEAKQMVDVNHCLLAHVSQRLPLDDQEFLPERALEFNARSVSLR
jgi:hypothetical protein